MAREMISYLKKKERFDEPILFDFLDSEIIKRNLSYFLSDIIMSDEMESRYYTKERILYYNPDDIFIRGNNTYPSFDLIISEFERRNRILHDENEYNIYNIHGINHELNHIVQLKICSEDDTFLKRILLYDLQLIAMDFKLHNGIHYKRLHDNFYCEYNANIESYIRTLELFSSFNLDELDALLVRANKIIANHIIYMYTDLTDKQKLSNPIDNLLKIHQMISDEEINLSLGLPSSVDNIERIRLGMQMDDNTFKYLYDISKGKKKTLNMFEDIRISN